VFQDWELFADFLTEYYLPHERTFLSAAPDVIPAGTRAERALKYQT